MEITIGRGDDRRKVPVAEASDRDLQYYAENARVDAIRDACVAELERRAMAGDGAPAEVAQQAQQDPPRAPQQTRSQAPSTALARVSVRTLDVTTAIQLANQLEELEKTCIVVAPSTAMADIPEGFSPALSIVKVNPSGGSQEVYPLPEGKLGLARATLDTLAGGTGASVVPHLTRRLDDASDPYFYECECYLEVRRLDGTIRLVQGHKQLDLRDGSPQYEALRKRAEAKYEREKKKDPNARMGDWESQIRDMRLFIAEHAETKARLRAIRALGFRASYSKEELAKPFAVVSLAATGRTNDPELKRQFAMANYAAAVSGTARLYGGTPAQPVRSLHARSVETTGMVRPPPVGSVPVDVEDEY